jgi:DNA-binding NarL/FixJ family response regulator
MPTKKLLFFDDYPLASENILFLTRLRKSVGPVGLVVVQERTITQLEDQLKAGNVGCLILDIMSRVPRGFRSIEAGEDGQDVSPAVAGIEILKRCRAGAYGESVRAIPIFMRTARGEPHIMRLCSQIGASGYFQVGIDDGALVMEILEVIEHGQ